MRRALAYVMSLVVFGAAVWFPSAVFGQVFPGNPIGGGGSGGGSSGCPLSGCTFTGAIEVIQGTAGAPALRMGPGTPTTGFYRRSGAVVSTSISGTGVTEQTSSGLNTTQTFGYYATVIGTAVDTVMRRHSAGVWSLGDDTASSIRALQGGGAAVASATALPLPTGRVFHVTGTTTVTSITSTNFEAGVCVTLIFDGVLTFTNGNNLELAGNFVTSALDTISLCYDGTAWFETGRSVNS